MADTGEIMVAYPCGLSQTNGSHALENLRKLFGQFGLPEMLVSDNGAQFTSAEFTEFCMKKRR
ncbi:hypothetical protein TTRE_0000894601 [Trichuris trichiura]|uniref:Integrase catalytic domain-containing protein n=1 Tax=Trichuris trichiura TaxID=36087 RepID=A0A077ZLE0_TRITR|nr:hypothetical protein TTRE_0000894601 [Trichuris trichiura]